MKIYTRTGDLGETALFGGGRIPKHHLRIEAYGTVDETNAVLGLAASRCTDPDLSALIARVQAELFEVGADLATPLDAKTTYIVRTDAAKITRLETEMDAWDLELPLLTSFILPGGTETAAVLHMARTVCRRAERATAALAAQEPINDDAFRYLNRLSDWLFMLARLANHRQNQPDIPWRPSKNPEKE
ncbi:MAG: cob(I)yrinic acid a,c-diamide adenosyltransferase [Caldilineales bacterium]|nr:cob(I)yrinic acid a,c-diamide adenosyltransferase [Caldilineales bacterium]